jgi:hypothetical protein
MTIAKRPAERFAEAIVWIALVLGAAGLIVGCAAAQPKPDDMSAIAHRREAARDQDAAARERAKYDPHAVAVARIADGRTDVGVTDYAATYNPTKTHLDKAARLEKHARQHAEAAAELEHFEEAECGSLSPRVRAACPVLSAIAIEVRPDGIRLFLKDPSTAADTIALMKCHLAYARTRGFERAPDCPLYLRGVEISADGRAVDVTSRDSAVAREIVQRGFELVDR